MPREPYAKIGEKAERRVGRSVVARPSRFLPSVSRKLFERVKFERDFGKCVSCGRKVKIRLGFLSFLGEERKGRPKLGGFEG